MTEQEKWVAEENRRFLDMRRKATEQLKDEIHFRTLDCPCCGNCKHFERSEGLTFCWRDGCDYFFPREYNLCDRFEEKEKDES